MPGLTEAFPTPSINFHNSPTFHDKIRNQLVRFGLTEKWWYDGSHQLPGCPVGGWQLAQPPTLMNQPLKRQIKQMPILSWEVSKIHEFVEFPQS